MRPLMHTTGWEDCDRMAASVMRSGAQEKAPALPVVIHSGVFVADEDLGTWSSPERKLRLGLLSFLASQDPNSFHLNFWTNDPSNARLRSALDPVLADDRYAKRVTVSFFNASKEFQSITPDPNASKLFIQLYEGNKLLASKADIMRIALLHNYGGMWVDADVLMVNSFAPLAGEDWAYLGQDNFINNALLSVSRPRSNFIRGFMAHAVLKCLDEAESGPDKNIYRFGPDMLKTIFQEVGSNPAEVEFFHVLPTCVFDGVWAMEKNAVGWDQFYKDVATPEQVKYISPGVGPPFGYHWHGRWHIPITSGSVFDEAEKLYKHKLALQL